MSRNRARLLAAARDVLVEQGADAPLDAIARRANVGNATLYRHFGDREELFGAVAADTCGHLADDAEAALAEESDPHEALRRYLRAGATRRIGAVISVLRGHFSEAGNAVLVADRERGIAAVTEILRRAQEAGQVRDDVSVTDIWVMLAQLTRPLPGSDCAALEGRTDRQVEILLAGLRAPAPGPLPGRPLTRGELTNPPTCGETPSPPTTPDTPETPETTPRG